MNPEGLEFKYALKCIYNAHASDVRVVKALSIPDGGILTGSRDNCAKVWAPEGKSFKECQIFSGSNAFVASLCVLPPSAQYPKGLFLAGSNDCSIYGFTPDSYAPVLRLLGHSGAVCTLSSGFGCFVSGSWDKTAKVWSGQQCNLTLQGHVEAVWATAVFSTQNLILTGSADHTIRLWRSGVCEKVFTGHEDCVRGLAIISDLKFLSCSNDSTVRLWLTSGECLEVFRSHTDYIYSISLLSNGMDFVTCGEDQNVKIWRNGECVQTIVLVPKSLWSVACLSNGNIAVGTSDGKVYVFEQVPVDYFEKASGDANPACIQESASMSDVDIKSSMYDGESVVFYENQNQHMYVCEFNHSTGTKIKKEDLDFKFIDQTFYKRPVEEVAANSDSLPREKDYVFNVDVEDTMYKLAFNKGENPWDVATGFVSDHNLPNDHIGQIVDYIIKNTANTFINEYFPAKNFLSYLNANLDGLKNKMGEFCSKVPNRNRLTLLEVEDLALLGHLPDEVTDEQLAYLDKAISWDDEYLFPVLDLIRLGVKAKGLAKRISTNEFVNHLMHIFLTTRKKVNRVLVVKILCNMFGIDQTEDVLTANQVTIFDSVKERISMGEDTIHKAGCALFQNFATASYNGFRLNTDRFCMNVVDILPYLTDQDAISRILLAIGTVCTRNSLAVSYFRSVNIKESLLKITDICNDSKVCRIVELLCVDF